MQTPLSSDLTRSLPTPPVLPSQDSLSLLHDVSRELASILDREELLHRVADLVKRLIDYQLFGVLLWDEGTQSLSHAVSVSWNGCQAYRIEVDAGRGLCGAAATLRRPIRVGDVTEEPRYINCGDQRVRSELVVPSLIEERLLGVIDLESYHRDAFGPEAEQLMVTLAANLAVALENARLYEQVKADETRLAQELSAARQMQRMLLPKSSPWAPGIQTAVAYCPARHLGGDLYDYLSYGEHRTAFILADVAGKGSGAALYGSLAIGMLRGYASENQCDPVCLLDYLNGELGQMRVGNRFLAATFAVYDRRDHSLLVGNAGLPYPWRLRDGKAEMLQVSGVPVGAMAAPSYSQIKIHLEPGDAVVLATDGIEEAMNPAGELFGEDRTRRALEELANQKAPALADGLLAATDEFQRIQCQDATFEPADDRTVLVIRRSHKG